jgi:cellulose synthase/poly-beta-1,6-N-acetylglucosamine synthase-like glycosyltransferase
MNGANAAGAPALVSVVVPAFNVAHYVDATLSSLCGQTYRSIEVLVVDDGSTDDTAVRVKRFAERDPRIRLVSHPVNRGLPAARNTGISAASGKFIAFLDADDIAKDSWIAEQVTALNQDQALGMFGAQCEALDEDGRETGVVWERPVDPAAASIGLLFRNTFSVGMTVRRSAIPAGGFADMPMAEDYDFNVRVAANWRVANSPKVLVGIRVRRGGLTGTKKEQMEECVRAVIRQQLQALGVEPTAMQMNLHRQIGTPVHGYSVELLRDAEIWLRGLIEANLRSGRFPSGDFMQAIAREWFSVCVLAAPLGWIAWDAFWASNLASLWRPGLAERLRLALKCLLRHDRMR